MGFFDNAKKKAAEAAELVRQKAAEAAELAKEKAEEGAEQARIKAEELNPTSTSNRRQVAVRQA